MEVKEYSLFLGNSPKSEYFLRLLLVLLLFTCDRTVIEVIKVPIIFLKKYEVRVI